MALSFDFLAASQSQHTYKRWQLLALTPVDELEYTAFLCDTITGTSCYRTPFFGGRTTAILPKVQILAGG